MTTLAISGGDAERLLEALGRPAETGWVLGARASMDGQILLGRTLADVPDGAYLSRCATQMQIGSSGFVPAFGRALHLDGIPVFVHTHPGADPQPSTLDDVVDRELSAFASARGLRGYASLILGGTRSAPRFTGRVYSGTTETAAITRLRVAGRHLRVHLSDHAKPGSPAPVFDRQVRAFGVHGQRLLGALRVGVVGAGGTGSAVVEQLARLGVGDLVIMDGDVVDETNLTRIHGSTTDDVGVPKAELAARLAESFGTGTRARAIVGSVACRAGVEALGDRDVVFGCTDDQAGRLVLSRFAYWYLVPVIDMGVMVDASEGQIRGVEGRVTVLAPGEPCLDCRGQVDAVVASAEMLDPARRSELAGQGYIPGVDGHAPAVVSFTTVTAGLAVSDLLGRLMGYADATSTQLLLRLHEQTVRPAGRPAREGHYCVTPENWGTGDSDPLLGIVGLR